MSTEITMDNMQAAVARLFQSDLLRAKNVGGRYFDWETASFDPEALERDMGPWSTNERTMAALALEIWDFPVDNPRDRFNARHCVGFLSPDNLMACVEAMALQGRLLRWGQQFQAVPRPQRA